MGRGREGTVTKASTMLSNRRQLLIAQEQMVGMFILKAVSLSVVTVPSGIYLNTKGTTSLNDIMARWEKWEPLKLAIQHKSLTAGESPKSKDCILLSQAVKKKMGYGLACSFLHAHGGEEI